VIESWSLVDASCTVLTRGCSADWWSVGILLYELLCGEAPFACSTNKLTYEFIAYSSKMPYFPAHVSHHARDLISRLLCRCGLCLSCFNPCHRNVCSRCVVQGCQSAFGVRR
jgi:serine/threonine protein kinase